MTDGLSVEMDALDVVDALNTLGDFAQPYINLASGESAESMEREAVARLRRQLGPNATGQTEAGIESRPAYDGNGYVVVSSRDWMPNLPLWIEKSTKKGRPGSSSQAARPFFYVSAELEKGPHFRRIGEALQDASNDRGLGAVNG
jgi:hypothetical protein